MAKTIIVDEETILLKLHDWLRNDADADELARVTAEIFGGECYFWGGDEYRIYPDENYNGAFGPAEE